MVGEHGGGAFVMVYIVSTLLISLPVFLTEVMIGRRSHTNSRDAFARLSRHHPFWKGVGYLPIFIPLLIASYYSVIGGWSVEYFWQSCRQTFVTMSPDGTGALFNDYVTSPWRPVWTHLFFLLVSAGVVAGGVKSGIEKFSKITLPVLFVLIVVIIVYSVTLPGSAAGVRYLIHPDWSELTPRTFAYAMGQSFYSLSLGMGAIITYGSYVKKQENILATSTGTAISDLLFAIMAGFAIMPAVFAAGIGPASGPGLIFDTLPYIFHQMGQTMPAVSSTAAILFFVTILFAAMTSSVSLLEVGVAYLIEEKKMHRRKACGVVFGATWAVGVLCSLSFGPLSGLHLFGRGIFDFLDMFSSNFLLTVGGLLAVIFVGWKMPKTAVHDEFTNGGTLKGNLACFRFFYFILKYVAPLAVLMIFLTNFL
jgi:NSS family neurotransmitter:Na+ symporter